MKFYKMIVLNNNQHKSTLSFNVRAPIDVEVYNYVSQHHKRKMTAQSIPIVIPHNQSRDMCELTGMSPSQLRDDFEFNRVLKNGGMALEVIEELEYEDPEGFYPVRS